MFSSLANLADEDLGKWVTRTVSFPNSMVDRITPVTTDADRDMAMTVFGIDDAWPVVCEDYEQWVLEDASPLGRPDFDAVGVQLVSDVEPDELMKLARLTTVSYGIRLETTGTAATAAIRHLGLTAIAVMAPSWFDDQLCREGAAYFVDQGIDVISATPSGPLGGPRAITAEATARAVKELVDTTGAQAVFIAGNGQRAIGAIDHLERYFGITVLTANQVLLWATLAGTNLQNKVTGYGRLFTEG